MVAPVGSNVLAGERMVKEARRFLCHEDGVDPVDFNMGCWFVASHFQELCSFFNISESERDNNEVACLKRFKAGPVVNRIKALADTEGRVFTL